MNIKTSVLERLETNREKYISGESLAKELGVSRQAISKAVNGLKSEGYCIYAVTNKGYMMPAECDVLSVKQITERTGTRVFLFDTIKSTNEEAAKRYLEGGECIVVSRTQSGGKRKDGGNFPSPLDKGIYFSIAIPLKIPLGKLLTLRKICGDTVAETIERTSGQTAVCKRVDEVYIGGNKVSGILIECAVIAASESTESAVIGIGIYSYYESLPTPLPVFPDETRGGIISEIYLKIKEKILDI